MLGLAPGGGYLAVRVTTNAGGLLHHLFTITAADSRGCLLLCGPLPSGRPDLGLPSTTPYGARTFLVPSPGRDRLADLGIYNHDSRSSSAVNETASMEAEDWLASGIERVG